MYKEKLAQEKRVEREAAKVVKEKEKADKAAKKVRQKEAQSARSYNLASLTRT